MDIELSVVVPVYNQAGSIVENVQVIHARVAAGVDGAVELIVVSDGSVDSTEERLLERELPGVRVFHYDRNLGKGYAIKTGALEARGRWIGYVDADLDIDPAGLPAYLEVAERDGLDFAIGSKRHPDSRVQYPRSRRIASWLFQQFVRLLLDLDVRDTQVGIKLFRREIADQVVPLLLVKRYAFDIELLGVARAFGFGRVRELPVVLDYKFTGSGVRSSAVLYALVDVLAIFYRLRVIRYYQRRRSIAGAFAWTRPNVPRPLVTVASVDPDAASRLDYESVERLELESDDSTARRIAAEAAAGDVVAFLEPGARPSGNWLSATVPFFARAGMEAVVTPVLAPAAGSARERAAAAISESRIGGGSLHFRFTPGNIRFVSDYPSRSFLVRRESLLQLDPAIPPEEAVLELVAGNGDALYVPEASVTVARPSLFRPYLMQVAAYGAARGRLIRRRISAVRLSSLAALAFLVFAAAGWLLALDGGVGLAAWATVWLVYLVLVAGSSLVAGLRFRSAAVPPLVAAGMVATHAVYAISFASGLIRSRRRSVQSRA
jgi:glycosyltransferase involved in cell wall biosynthesis